MPRRRCARPRRRARRTRAHSRLSRPCPRARRARRLPPPSAERAPRAPTSHPSGQLHLALELRSPTRARGPSPQVVSPTHADLPPCTSQSITPGPAASSASCSARAASAVTARRALARCACRPPPVASATSTSSSRQLAPKPDDRRDAPRGLSSDLVAAARAFEACVDDLAFPEHGADCRRSPREHPSRPSVTPLTYFSSTSGPRPTSACARRYKRRVARPCRRPRPGRARCRGLRRRFRSSQARHRPSPLAARAALAPACHSSDMVHLYLVLAPRARLAPEPADRVDEPRGLRRARRGRARCPQLRRHSRACRARRRLPPHAARALLVPASRLQRPASRRTRAVTHPPRPSPQTEPTSRAASPPQTS